MHCPPRGTGQPPRPDLGRSEPLLLDLGRFPHPVPQVVELRPADIAPGENLDPGEDRGVDGERPLDPHPEAHLPDGERLPQPAALPADDHALEDLHPFPVAFHDPDVDLQRVAGPEVGDVVPEGGAVDEVGALHGEAPAQQKRTANGGEHPSVTTATPHPPAAPVPRPTIRAAGGVRGGGPGFAGGPRRGATARSGRGPRTGGRRALRGPGSWPDGCTGDTRRARRRTTPRPPTPRCP